MDKVEGRDAGGRLLHACLVTLEWIGWCVVVPIGGVAAWAAAEPHGNVWMPCAVLTAVLFSLFGAWRVTKRTSVRRSFILMPVVYVCSLAAGLATSASASAVVMLFFFLDAPP